MARYVTRKPLDLPPRDAAAEGRRADLIFYGVDHLGPSYIGRVFLGNEDADESTPLDPSQGYAGHFTIFGHNGCAGDKGHCDVPDEPPDAFDHGLPHPLTPLTVSVEVSDALKLVRGRKVSVTVVPIEPHADGPRISDALHFESVRLVTYEGTVTAQPQTPA
ncbi:MAG: hypothetical protein QOJ57_1411 [Thermoleophilaceae bacterium]|jgi:hypothetical protein|nr:hypothetical protein [Thermoleophilaceae bacterium]